MQKIKLAAVALMAMAAMAVSASAQQPAQPSAPAAVPDGKIAVVNTNTDRSSVLEAPGIELNMSLPHHFNREQLFGRALGPGGNFTAIG